MAKVGRPRKPHFDFDEWQRKELRRGHRLRNKWKRLQTPEDIVNEERDRLEAEAIESRIKTVECEACPRKYPEKDMTRVGDMTLCPVCAGREKEVSERPTARVLEYKPSAEFPALNKPTHAQTDIPNNDLDPATEEYQAVFNDMILKIAMFPDDKKLEMIRERIDKLDAFMRVTRIQRQTLFVAIDNLYKDATEQERAALLKRDQEFKAAHPRKTRTDGPKKASGEIKLTNREHSYPSHWDAKARKAATVFLDMGLTMSETEDKLRGFKLVK